MLNQIQSQNTVAKSYDAGDVQEGYSLAHEQALDASVMVGMIDDKFSKTVEYLHKVYGVPLSAFSDLKRLIRITNNLIEDGLEFSKSQEEVYEKEWQAIDDEVVAV